MTKYREALLQSPLFRGKTAEQMDRLFSLVQITETDYEKNEWVATEGDPISALGLVASATVEVRKGFSSGTHVTLARFGPGHTFGEAALFVKAQKFPATIVASEPAVLLWIPKGELLKLFAIDSEVLARFIESMSERVMLLNRKIEQLSLTTIRQRVAYDLLQFSRKLGATRFKLPYSIRSWAEHLGIPRPSLSRELGKLREEGFVQTSGTNVEILDMMALEKVFI